MPTATATVPTTIPASSILNTPLGAEVERLSLHFDDRTKGDLPRDAARMIVKVTVPAERRACGCPVGGGQHRVPPDGRPDFQSLPPLEHLFEIYADELPVWERELRTDDGAAIERAKAECALAREEWFKDECDGKRGLVLKRAMEYLNEMSPGGWYLRGPNWPQFLRGRECGLLATLEVVETLPPPETPSTVAREHNKALAGAIAEAVRGGRSDEIAELRAMVTQQAAQIAELTARRK